MIRTMAADILEYTLNLAGCGRCVQSALSVRQNLWLRLIEHSGVTLDEFQRTTLIVSGGALTATKHVVVTADNYHLSCHRLARLQDGDGHPGIPHWRQINLLTFLLYLYVGIDSFRASFEHARPNGPQVAMFHHGLLECSLTWYFPAFADCQTDESYLSLIACSLIDGLRLATKILVALFFGDPDCYLVRKSPSQFCPRTLPHETPDSQPPIKRSFFQDFCCNLTLPPLFFPWAIPVRVKQLIKEVVTKHLYDSLRSLHKTPAFVSTANQESPSLPIRLFFESQDNDIWFVNHRGNLFTRDGEQPDLKIVGCREGFFRNLSRNRIVGNEKWTYLDMAALDVDATVRYIQCTTTSFPDSEKYHHAENTIVTTEETSRPPLGNTVNHSEQSKFFRPLVFAASQSTIAWLVYLGLIQRPGTTGDAVLDERESVNVSDDDNMSSIVQEPSSLTSTTTGSVCKIPGVKIVKPKALWLFSSPIYVKNSTWRESPCCSAFFFLIWNASWLIQIACEILPPLVYIGPIVCSFVVTSLLRFRLIPGEGKADTLAYKLIPNGYTSTANLAAWRKRLEGDQLLHPKLQSNEELVVEVAQQCPMYMVYGARDNLVDISRSVASIRAASGGQCSVQELSRESTEKARSGLETLTSRGRTYNPKIIVLEECSHIDPVWGNGAHLKMIHDFIGKN